MGVGGLAGLYEIRWDGFNWRWLWIWAFWLFDWRLDFSRFFCVFKVDPSINLIFCDKVKQKQRRPPKSSIRGRRKPKTQAYSWIVKDLRMRFCDDLVQKMG